MSRRTLTSVVIPTFNRVCYLRDALDSITAQSCGDYEIIVVDDGSTDGTAEMVSAHPAGVRLIRQQNSGPAAARNSGIMNARGEFIAFLDSDDLWHREKLARQLAFFRANPAIGLVATAYETTGGQGEARDEVFLSERDLRTDRRRLAKNIFATSSVMVKRSCFDSAGLFNEQLRFAEDWDMWLRILDRYDYGYLPEVLLRYRYHGANTTAASWHDNMRDWRKVIDMHSTGGTLIGSAILKRRRLSWLYVNQAVTFRGTDPRLERKYLLASIAAWPFSMPGRYSAIVRGLSRYTPPAAAQALPDRQPPGGDHHVHQQ